MPDDADLRVRIAIETSTRIPTVEPEVMGIEEAAAFLRITIRELIDHRKNGFLVPPDDVPALAHCLEELLADPDLRKHITARGRLRIQEEFALDVNVGRLRSALESVEMRKGGGTHARQ